MEKIMFALAERLEPQFRKSRLPDLEEVIRPPIAFWNPNKPESREAFSHPILYFKGLMLGPVGTSCLPKKIENTRAQIMNREFPLITKENFMELVGLCVLRQHRAGPGLPWEEAQTVSISNSPEELNRQNFIYDLLDSYPNHSFINVFNLQTEFKQIAQRDQVIEIATRVDGHNVPEELFTLRMVLPRGVTAHEVFEYFSTNNPTLPSEKNLFVGHKNDIWGPQYQELKKFYEYLQEKQIGDQKQVEEGLHRINWQIESTKRTEELICRMVNGHLCARVFNYQGEKEWKAIVEVIDDEKTLTEILELEDRLQGTELGQIVKYTPATGISAATSKNEPDKKKIENFWIQDKEGNWHNFMKENDALEFRRQNFPDMKPRLMLEPQTQPNILPNPNLQAGHPLPFELPDSLRRNYQNGDPLVYPFKNYFMPESESSGIAPAFVFLFVVNQRSDETKTFFEKPVAPVDSFRETTTPTIPITSKRRTGEPSGVSERIIHVDSSVNQRPTVVAVPTHVEQPTYFIPQPIKPQGGGGEKGVIHELPLRVIHGETIQTESVTNIETRRGVPLQNKKVEDHDSLQENNIHTVGARFSRPIVETQHITSLRVADQSIDHSIEKESRPEEIKKDISQGRDVPWHVSTIEDSHKINVTGPKSNVYKGVTLSPSASLRINRQGDTLSETLSGTIFPRKLFEIPIPQIGAVVDLDIREASDYKLSQLSSQMALLRLAFEYQEGLYKREAVQHMQLPLPSSQTASALLGLFFLIFLNYFSSSSLPR